MHPVQAGESVQDKFFLNGDPIYVFDKAHMSGTFANKYAECDVTDYVSSFDTSTADVTYKFSYDTFNDSPLCNTTANLRYLGYSPATDNGIFTAHIDVNAVVVAAAVRVKQLLLMGDMCMYINTCSM